MLHARAGCAGKGIYFSGLSSTALQYAQSMQRKSDSIWGSTTPPAAGGSQGGTAGRQQQPYQIILSRVLLGRVGNGHAAVTAPPSGCDSTCSSYNSAEGDMAYAIFDGAQAYPLYIITFRA